MARTKGVAKGVQTALSADGVHGNNATLKDLNAEEKAKVAQLIQKVLYRPLILLNSRMCAAGHVILHSNPGKAAWRLQNKPAALLLLAMGSSCTPVVAWHALPWHTTLACTAGGCSWRDHQPAERRHMSA